MLTEERIKEMQEWFAQKYEEMFSTRDEDSLSDFYQHGYCAGASVVLKRVLEITEDD